MPPTWGLSRYRWPLLRSCATAAIIGGLIGYAVGTSSGGFIPILLPFTAGGFIYIAGSNLIPELHKGCNLKESVWHVLFFIAGIALMLGLKFIE